VLTRERFLTDRTTDVDADGCGVAGAEGVLDAKASEKLAENAERTAEEFADQVTRGCRRFSR